jgi:tRNA (cmo5U34)-methyltransferase
MALHHVLDKGPLYRRLCEALKPGGTFAFADELIGADPAVQGRFWERWLEFAREPGGLSETEIADVIDHMESFDHYEMSLRQFELLQEAGFRSIDCVWRYLNYAVFVAS